jgi:hypothetical protein
LPEERADIAPIAWGGNVKPPEKMQSVANGCKRLQTVAANAVLRQQFKHVPPVAALSKAIGTC